jgi:hypothetical protein
VGALFVIIILVFPGGIMGTISEKFMNRKMSKLQGAATAGAGE